MCSHFEFLKISYVTYLLYKQVLLFAVYSGMAYRLGQAMAYADGLCIGA